MENYQCYTAWAWIYADFYSLFYDINDCLAFDPGESRDIDFKKSFQIILGRKNFFLTQDQTLRIAPYVTSSLKIETKNSTEFTEIYTKIVNSTGFINEYYKQNLSTEQIKDDIVDGMYGDVYISLALVYAISAIFNFFAPAIVKLFGHKLTMVRKPRGYYYDVFRWSLG